MKPQTLSPSDCHRILTPPRQLLPLILLFSGLFLFAKTTLAQDPGFSQFFASPLTLNPALTGKFNGVVRVAGNYRNQWPSINNPFFTPTISMNPPILRNKLPQNNPWGHCR